MCELGLAERGRGGARADPAQSWPMRIASDQVRVPGSDQLFCGFAAAAPKAPVDRRCGQLYECSSCHQRRHLPRVFLNLGISLGVGDDGCDSALRQVPDLGRELERPAVVWELDQQVVRIAAQAEASQLVAV